MEKKCNKCRDVKNIDNFYKTSSNKDGYVNFCKKCNSIIMEKYNKTIRGLVTRIYGAQRHSSKKRGYNMPNYTSKELEQWIIKQANFHDLYKEWVDSGYSKLKTPSCDRLNDYLSYTLDNLRLTDWDTNKNKGHSDRRCGVNNKGSRPVLQYSLDGVFMQEYHSEMEAKRQTGVDNGNISRSCNSEYKSSGGYIWKYKT